MQDSLCGQYDAECTHGVRVGYTTLVMTDEAAPSPFDESINSVSEGASHFFLVRHRVTTLILVFGTLSAVAFFGWLEWRFSDWSMLSGDALQSAFMVPLLPLFVPIAAVIGVSLRVQRQFKQQLAEAIGFSYAESAPIASVGGHIFTFGHDPCLVDVYSGMYDDYHPARIYRLQFTIGYGKSSHVESLPVWEMDYGRTLPQFLLKPKRNFSFSQGWQPPKAVLATLEGNFNEFFELFVEPENQIEVRQLFEPTILALLIDSFREFGFETFGTKLYIFSTEPAMKTKQSFIKLRSLADSLYTHLAPELQNISVRP